MPSRWRTKAEKVLGACLGLNQDDRVLLAHSLLEATNDGSVRITRLQLSNGQAVVQTWDEAKWSQKITTLHDLTKQVKEIKAELGTVKITVPDLLGWMAVDPTLPVGARTSPEAIRAIFSFPSDWVPRPLD